jgi:hypothetical protein
MHNSGKFANLGRKIINASKIALKNPDVRKIPREVLTGIAENKVKEEIYGKIPESKSDSALNKLATEKDNFNIIKTQSENNILHKLHKTPIEVHNISINNIQLHSGIEKAKNIFLQNQNNKIPPAEKNENNKTTNSFVEREKLNKTNKGLDRNLSH